MWTALSELKLWGMSGELLAALWETLYMVAASTALSLFFGFILAMVMVMTGRGGLAPCRPVYLTLDTDVLPAAVAPGVSAPAPLGVPLWCVEAVVDAVLASGKLVAAEVAEFNPAFDRDGITAKVVARLAARIARVC